MSEQLISPAAAAGDMLAAAAYLAQHMKSSDGHAEAMKTIVPRYLERGNVDLAAELANTIDDPYTRDRLLIQVAEKCAELGDEDYGMQLADAIEDVGMQSQARERIAIRKAVSGDIAKAESIAVNIINPDYVYAEIAASAAKSGLESRSSEALSRIELPVVRASALQAIAAWHLSEGRKDEAMRELGKAAAAGEEIEYGEEKVRALGEIANAFSEAGGNDLAVVALRDAQDGAEKLSGTHRDMLLSATAIGFMKVGDTDAADAALDLVGDRTQIASGLLGFAREYWAAGDKEEAMEALEEGYSILRSQKDSDVRDSRAAYTLLGLISVQFAEFGKPERAIEIAQENPDENQRINTLARIAQTATLEGNSDAVDLAVRAIVDESQRVFALFGIAQAHAKLGDSVKAEAVLDQAVDLATDLPQPLTKASVLESAAIHYREYELPDKERAAALKCLDAIVSIRSDSGRAAALASLSELYDKNGMTLGEAEQSAIAAMIRQSEW